MVDKHEDFGEASREINRRYILGNGKETKTETQQVCAKMHILVENGKQTNFCYVKFFRGKMFDPQGIDATKIRISEFKRVNEKIFNLYFDYLKTKNGESLIRAEREYIHV